MSPESEHPRLRFLGWGVLFPMVVGLVIVLSLAAADVIVSYEASSSVGANSNTPFYFQDGPNYVTASTDGFVTIVCSGAALAAPTTCGGTATPAGQSTETIVLSGVQAADLYAISISEFVVSANFPAAGQAFNIGPVLGTSTIAGPTCVYAFFTTQQPTAPASLSNTIPSGQPLGCGVFEPTVAGGSMEDLNLETGAGSGVAIDNPTGCAGQAGVTYVGGGCATNFYTGQAGSATATPLLYITLVVVATATAASGTSTFFINPVVT